jgi:glycosyltransferase involved in cell wall biosynthesis
MTVIFFWQNPLCVQKPSLNVESREPRHERARQEQTMKITLVTDAWHPQVNGVVRSVENTNRELETMGIDVSMITPAHFASVPCPTYPEIRLSLARRRKVARLIEEQQPACVHIVTEGPLGLAARSWCIRNEVPFTTSYHTRFPEYVAARFPVPTSLLYRYVRWFHNAGTGCMVATESLETELAQKGLNNLLRWSRGIDATLFRPRPKVERPFDLPRPIFMTVGRVSVEKNLPAFLALDLPGSKVVVGDGPARKKLEAQFPDALFTGVKFGAELAEAYAQADVFVFPSKTDTFGNTILEALASGVPVAAYPVTGPIDILGRDPDAGALNNDLHLAAMAALDCSPDAALALGRTFTWEAATEQFWNNVLIANHRREIITLMKKERVSSPLRQAAE